MADGPKYALVTAARNEEAFIGKTIESVIAQTIQPICWAIVSDGSTDRTDEIAHSYAKEHDFIRPIRLEERDRGRWGFASKAHAVTAGYETLDDLEFEFVGNLDADGTFAPTYYEEVFKRLAANPKWGIAGGVTYDTINGEFVRIAPTANHCPGFVQMFRRECYEQVGGYPALRYGGIDTAAEVLARMNGWETRSIPELSVYHHRRTGTGGGSIWRARFREGARDYGLGWHPLYMTLKSFSRCRGRPYCASLITLFAYFVSLIRREERQISKDFVRFVHKEQRARLKSLFGAGASTSE